ncbi:MAG TPA: SEC-C metal-binding domain-containing protein, partial [Trueperaceae bacterium]|nr:SEC-C metal-binding domain-containing protein [Trueperaceae bacterium]
YAFEGYNLFEEMNANIRLNVAKLLFRVQVNVDQRLERRQQRQAPVQYSASDQGGLAAAAAAAPRGGAGPARGTGPTSPIRVGEKVGRNDPCPCGSGKKYKHCHGRDQAVQA